MSPNKKGLKESLQDQVLCPVYINPKIRTRCEKTFKDGKFCLDCGQPPQRERS